MAVSFTRRITAWTMPATSCESIAIFIIDLERPTETWMLVFANYWVPSYFICASRGDAERSSCMLAVRKPSTFIGTIFVTSLHPVVMLIHSLSCLSHTPYYIAIVVAENCVILSQTSPRFSGVKLHKNACESSDTCCVKIRVCCMLYTRSDV